MAQGLESRAAQLRQREQELARTRNLLNNILESMHIDGQRYTVGVARDITVRKQAETALRQSEQQLRTLFETAPVGIFTTTVGGRQRFSNEANAVIHGYASPEEFQQAAGERVVDLYVDPADRITFLQRLQQQGAVKSFETRHRKKDGSSIWIAIWAKLRSEPDSGETLIEGFCIDITERKKAEQEIREAREYLNSVVNAIGDPIFVKDGGHRFVLANDALCALVGHDFTLSYQCVGTSRRRLWTLNDLSCTTPNLPRVL